MSVRIIVLKKSHTCEGGTNLKISVCHLLMNLKNNFLLKKVLKCANKKCKNFNIYNVVLKKNTWRYIFTPRDIIILKF